MEDQHQKLCYVIMGFGIKTDFATGRQLDLDKSYKELIKPIVEKKGLTCLRADEITYSGFIDIPNYEYLLQAELVIADLSTSNPYALYELGLRHALRPRATIIISESKLGFFFDINALNVLTYQHLGDSIDFEEVLRFQEVLGKQIDASLANESSDSPVYTYLNDLMPPRIKGKSLEISQPRATDNNVKPGSNENKILVLC